MLEWAFERDLCFQASEVHPEAHMWAKAKSNMSVGTAVCLEVNRVFETDRAMIGSNQLCDDLVALFQSIAKAVMNFAHE